MYFAKLETRILFCRGRWRVYLNWPYLESLRHRLLAHLKNLYIFCKIINYRIHFCFYYPKSKYLTDFKTRSSFYCSVIPGKFSAENAGNGSSSFGCINPHPPQKKTIQKNWPMCVTYSLKIVLNLKVFKTIWKFVVVSWSCVKNACQYRLITCNTGCLPVQVNNL